MGLSLDSIHAPLNDFFLNHFKSDIDSPVLFRFDKFGSVISDQDFTDPGHPELGYSQGLAMERFSDLVNHIPTESSDGINIVLSQDSIDETYFFRLLSPATAAVPSDATDDESAAILGSFGAIKLSGQKKWDNVKAQSSTGLLVQYKPSLAEPTDWYDSTKKNAWTDQSFTITDNTPAPPSSPPNNLWRLKLSDAALQNVVNVNKARLSPAVLASIATVKPVPAAPVVMRPMVAMRATPVARVAGTAAMRPVAAAAADPVVIRPAASTFALHDSIRMQLASVAINQRIAVNEAVGASAPTQPAKTNSISIAFSYCLVKISRPWYMDAFISDKTWCIPGVQKGSLSAGGGGGISLMPVGLVAVRNLTIEANWSSDDLANAAQATDFGPFRIDSSVVNNKLSHPGIQVVGWLLQRMPDLPPNDPSDN